MTKLHYLRVQSRTLSASNALGMLWGFVTEPLQCACKLAVCGPTLLSTHPKRASGTISEDLFFFFGRSILWIHQTIC